ncbi:MAG: Sec translocon accessory complex subunit YajC [Candidatus Moanabacter tarae]|uniref:Sec translocon accessory complex subunit YajC n=1 Tax=Candidatus Moanibacter tarae TaxID=2200854 RepID=A0A2Z4AEV7_9BACT|nr:MAG: Sec translocon accessory complex subunit YajC [Candidatus Moanabacter tarae]|tara:strand:- start:1162 stop:1485 length:324 start_codon:yes stop_codon:yes gene_type:complete
MSLFHNPIQLLPTLAQAGGAGSGGGSIIFFYILLFAGLWFLLLAPQRKRQKAHAKLLSELQSGDYVITSSGIYGEITNVKEDRFVVKIAENTKIELSKNAVQSKIEN